MNEVKATVEEVKPRVVPATTLYDLYYTDGGRWRVSEQDELPTADRGAAEEVAREWAKAGFVVRLIVVKLPKVTI